MTAATDALPPARRDRKKAETRAALRQAALAIAIEQGYENLTVEAITEAADVSTRTFFNYFSSKDEALLAPDVDRAQALATALLGRPADEPLVTSLRSVFLHLAGDLADQQPAWRARMELVNAHPQLWPRLISGFHDFERGLAEAIAARTSTDPLVDLHPAVVAAAVAGALRVAITQWHATNESQSLSELLAEAFDVLAGGMALVRPHPSDPHAHPHPQREEDS